MARKHDSHPPETLFESIQANPGEKPSFFAKLLGWQRSDVTRVLPALNDHELYLYEDEQGRLYPCAENNNEQIS